LFIGGCRNPLYENAFIMREYMSTFDDQKPRTLHRSENRKIYRGADKSLAWPGRKQANVSVRMT